MTVSLVLRLCGLLLCLLHTVILSASLILLRLDLPSARYDIVAAILENSSFLPLGLLLVLLSLHPQLLRPRLSEAGEPGEAAPALLLKSRPLIALLAAAYIALLPAQIRGPSRFAASVRPGSMRSMRPGWPNWRRSIRSIRTRPHCRR